MENNLEIIALLVSAAIAYLIYFLAWATEEISTRRYNKASQESYKRIMEEKRLEKEDNYRRFGHCPSCGADSIIVPLYINGGGIRRHGRIGGSRYKCSKCNRTIADFINC